MIAALICLLPTLYEIFDDRNGEDKKGKVRDFYIAVVLYCLVALVNWCMFVTHPLKSLALSFAWRVLIFDYAIAYVLIRRGVIIGKWWSYHGKTAKWDVIIARIDWRILMATRLALFALAVGWLLF